MKFIYFFLMVFLAACNNAAEKDVSSAPATDTVDTPATAKDDLGDTATVLPADTGNEPAVTVKDPPAVKPPEKTYSNQRFRNVQVEVLGNDRYRIRGEAQIFEANFGWVVEDGHNELQQGHQMTDAGAPAWGQFDFTVEVKKQRPNSTLTLILFESSAKDGSRQYELPVRLS